MQSLRLQVQLPAGHLGNHHTSVMIILQLDGLWRGTSRDLPKLPLEAIETLLQANHKQPTEAQDDPLDLQDHGNQNNKAC